MSIALPPLSVVAFILCSVASQVLLKAAGMHAAGQTSIWNARGMNPFLWLSLCCLALGMPLWARTLRLLPLATVYSWTALTYVFTPFCGSLFWGEQLSFVYFAGLACIVCGIIITTRNVVE